MKTRARGVLLAVLGALLTAPAPVSAAAPDPVRVVVTTANVLTSLSDRRARADISRAANGSTIVIAQEMWHRRPGEVAPAGWTGYQPRGPIPACRGNMILWRRDVWRVRRSRSVVVNRSGLFPYAPRCATVVVLQHRATGRKIPLVDVHMIPHVEIAGRPRNLPRRIALYAHDMSRVAQLARAIGANRGLVIMGGDWNVDYYADRRVRARPFPFAHLSSWMDAQHAPKLRLGRTAPTHGSRHIDTIWWSESRRIRPLDSTTIRRTHSDHNFARVVLAVRP